MNEAEIESLLAEQRRELMAAKDLESDLDLAFRLQLQEAMAASLAMQPLQPSTSIASTSSSSSQSQAQTQAQAQAQARTPPPGIHGTERPPPDLSFQDCFADFFDDEFDGVLGFEDPMGGIRFQKNKVEGRPEIGFQRYIHCDRRTERENLGVPVPAPLYSNRVFMEIPLGEGCSSSRVCDRPFKLYFKGLVSDEFVRGRDVTLAAVGVAICDSRDNLVQSIQKPLIDDSKNQRVVELKALIEGLNAALSLDVKRINFHCVNMTIYKQITGRWSVKQRKIATLVNQVVLLQQKFEICRPLLVAGKDVKFAFKLARDAIDSQISRSVETHDANNSKETCTICLEDIDGSEMIAVDGCLHRYCFSCMKQHVEVKILHGMVPACPHEGCNTGLKLDSCRKFLSPKFIEMMSQRIKEDSIPVTEKVYCPYPKCSTLMSKIEVLEYANNMFNGANRSGVRKCVKCHGLFCIDCKVPWHSNMSCNEYRRLNPRAEEAKLKSLATQKLWRQCVKCNHMIELAEGCYHMTCRCGYEFCYTCGAEWKNKKATCSCPLWDEENILHHDFGDEEDFDDDDDYDYDDYYDYEDHRFGIDIDDEFDEFNHRHFF